MGRGRPPKGGRGPYPGITCDGARTTRLRSWLCTTQWLLGGAPTLVPSRDRQGADGLDARPNC